MCLYEAQKLEGMKTQEDYPTIDHFRNELFINSTSGYESRARHAEYLPRPIVG